MTRSLIGALALSALANMGCSSKQAGSNYSGSQQQPGEYGSNDTQPSGSSVSGAASSTAKGVSGAASDAAGTATQSVNNPANLAKSNTINGTLKSKSGDMVTVVAPDQATVKLNAGGMAQISDSNGQKIDLVNLPEGSRVKATYRFDGTDYQALQIQVVAPGGPNDPGSPATP